MAQNNAEIYKPDQYSGFMGPAASGPSQPGDAACDPPQQTHSEPAASPAPPIQGLFDWRKALFPWSVIGPAFREECRAIAAGRPMPRFLSPHARMPASYPGVTLKGRPFTAAELELRRDIAAIVGQR